MKIQRFVLITTITIFAFIVLNSSVVQATEFTIKDGTAVVLETLEKLKSGQNKVGESVALRVRQDLSSPEGEILFKSGARAYGTITKSKPHGMFGKAGELEFKLNYLEAIDGSQVPIRATLENQGKGCSGAVITSFLLIAWPAMFINGENVVIPPSTEITAYVDRDAKIQIRGIEKVGAYEQIGGSGGSGSSFGTDSGSMKIFMQDNFFILDFSSQKLAFSQDEAKALENILTKALVKFQNAEEKKTNIVNDHIGNIGENLKFYFWSTDDASNTCINMQYKGENNRFSKKDVLNMINGLNQLM